ncbi:hypothetical protein PIIN_04811 [Serendipita indica DSM 11827]|uniref:Uncharacterized protein n=1 Tax=Serendipita indica (strain DSM 11827) TaxID=1109443 RepID=G4THT2_SERID|nr:hypothetical protein PIIN_04811 [Serendipita indica DSM 11827]
MDATARPYFIHHRNQVEINKALMDLFRLIDYFLQSDESARDPLMSLRVVSDYMQRKGLIAPMPAEVYDLNENDTNVQPNPLSELTRLMMTSIPQSHPTPPSHGITPSGNANSTPPRRELAHSFSESPGTTAVPLWHDSPIRQAFPDNSKLHPNTDATCISGTREKIKAWLARPTTQALRRWASRKAPSMPFSRPRIHEGDFDIIGREVYDAEEIAVTRPSSSLLYGIRIDTERVVKEDPLPIRDAHSKSLPPIPGDHRRSKSLSYSSPRNTASSALGRSATSVSRGGTQRMSPTSPLIPVITIQPPTPPTSMYQTYDPSSPAYSMTTLEAPLQSPTTSLRSISSSTSSQHRVRRKPVQAYADKPSTTTPISPIRTTTSPITPSPLRHELQLCAVSPPPPIKDKILDSPHEDHMKQLTELAEGLGLELSANGVATPLKVSNNDSNDLSQLVDVSRAGRAQSLSRRPQMHTGSGHRRDASRCSFVSSVAPSLSTVSENSHSSEDEDGVSEFLDCSEPQNDNVRRVTLPSGETLLLHGEDLEEWEMGEAMERVEKHARQLYTQEIDLTCVDHEASSVSGGILADIAARRKPSIRSHGSGSLSSRRSRK